MKKMTQAEREAVLESMRVQELENEAVDLRRQLRLLKKWRLQGRSRMLLRQVALSIERNSAAALGKPYETAREYGVTSGARLHVVKRRSSGT